jgi:hypothetical protein
VFNTIRFRAQKAIASIFLVTGLFAVALAVPNPITNISEAKAGANDPPIFGQRYIREDGDFIYLVHSNGVYYQNQVDLEFYSNLSGTAPDVARFTVMVGTSPNPVTSIVVIRNYVLKLSVTNRIAKDAVVTIAYSAAGTTSKIQTISGVSAEEFGIPVPLAVANLSTHVPSTPTPTPTPTASGGPSWDTAPLTDSERDSNTVGIFPKPVPGNVIITNEFGFVVGKGNTIKPRIRMKNYAGTIAMTLTATYKDKGKNKTYTCKFQPFGTAKKLPSAKWRWYTPKKACVLPAALVTSIQSGKSTLKANATWKRQWFNGKKTKPSGARIKGRTLKYTLKGAAR